MIDTKSFAIGLILVALGALLLAENLNYIRLSWDTFWPWLLICGGIVFCLAWFQDRTQNGLLIPGVTFLVYGILFWYCANYGWWRMGHDNLWSFFLIGPGLGFFAMYFLGAKERALLLPAGIMTGLGLVFWSGPENLRLVWPVALILVGLQLVLRNRNRNRRRTPFSSTDSPSAMSPPEDS